MTLDRNIGKGVKARAYNKLSKKQLGDKQQRVLDCLKDNPDGLTDKEIAKETRLSLSCVNGRRNELMHMGKVIPYTINSYVGKNKMPNVVWGVKCLK